MQLPAALTFVLDGVLMGANDFRDLRWQTTLAFAACLPVFAAVLARPSLGIVTVWLGMLAVDLRTSRQEPRPRPGRPLAGQRRRRALTRSTCVDSERRAPRHNARSVGMRACG